jgi:hypothetical protein
MLQSPVLSSIVIFEKNNLALQPWNGKVNIVYFCLVVGAQDFELITVKWETIRE